MSNDPRRIPYSERTFGESTLDRARPIRLVVFDVDGVLTDGKITYLANGLEIKSFSVKDGQGISLLHQRGISTAIISARDSAVTDLRAKELGITRVYQGIKNKPAILETVCEELGVLLSHTAFMGDDFPDLACLEMVGLPAAPFDAIEEVKSAASFVSKSTAGNGAVRELCDLILIAQQSTVSSTL
ncbi:MAG: HAD hydrolase family protein [Cyanobacteria bacterium]|nr:HAD hydrolase family protein [Cyanobacteriota bacterium]